MNMHQQPIIAPAAYPNLTVIEIARTIAEFLATGEDRAPGEINDAIAVFCRQRFAHVGHDVLREAVNIVEFRLRNPTVGKMAIEPLRQIEPLEIAEFDIAPIEDAKPTIEWVDPRTLWIDPLYQRSVSERGRKLIRGIIEGFSWRKFSPPTCAWTKFDNEMILVCTDGQHRAIGAASRPDIPLIPVQIIDAATTQHQAESFVTTNSARISVSKLQLHQSALIAGDADALTIERIANTVGVQVLKSSSPRYEPGDTTAIGSIYGLLHKHGFERTKLILRTLAKARLAPIDENHLKAAALLFTDREYRDTFESDALSEAIHGLSLVDRDEARQLAAAKDMPYWRALAATWYKRTRKTRKPRKAA